MLYKIDGGISRYRLNKSHAMTIQSRYDLTTLFAIRLKIGGNDVALYLKVSCHQPTQFFTIF